MADMAKVKDIDENLMRPPVTQPSLPFRAAQGLKKFATNVVAPAATSVIDATSLYPRAVVHTGGEVISGILGDRPSEQFQKTPFTTGLSRMVNQTPVEQGIKFPTMPQIGQGGGLIQQPNMIGPQEVGLRTAAAVGEIPSIVSKTPVIGIPEAPRAVPRQTMLNRPEAPSTLQSPAGRRLNIGAPEAPGTVPSSGTTQIEPSNVNYAFNIKPPTLLEPPAFRSILGPRNATEGELRAYATRSKAISDYNQALIGRYAASLNAAGVPKDLAQAELLRVQASELPKEGESKRGLTAAETAEIPLEGASKRGLREAQAFESRQRGQAAGLLPFTSMVPTGEVDIYTGEPKMTKQTSFYDVATGRTVGPGRSQQPRGGDLRSTYAGLSESKRNIVDKYFGDRQDVTPDEVLTYIKSLGE